MGLLGTLFGSDKVIDSLTSGITRGIDAAIFTKEEKANFMKDMVLKLQDQWMPRAISRRIVAILITTIFVVFCLTALVFACFSKTEVCKDIIDVAIAFKLGWIQGAIIVFYFGYYGAAAIKEAK